MILCWWFAIRTFSRSGFQPKSYMIAKSLKFSIAAVASSRSIHLQVGKLSLKWEAEEKTKVIGTYPPVVAQNEKRWTGYVEKDTAGQTNIYAVEVSEEMQAQVFVFVITLLTWENSRTRHSEHKGDKNICCNWIMVVEKMDSQFLSQKSTRRKGREGAWPDHFISSVCRLIGIQQSDQRMQQTQKYLCKILCFPYEESVASLHCWKSRLFFKLEIQQLCWVLTYWWWCIWWGQPTVYVAESAISTGSAGGSVEDSNNLLAVAVGLGLIAVVSASAILLQVGQNTPTSQDSSIYSGPPLSYYVAKFSPTVVTAQATVPEAPVLDN
jgi:hypothetical protein